MSIGNLPQTLELDKKELILILGENIDLGGNDNKNGTGKSSILGALSYVLFGAPLTNIRKDNLINASNGKGMVVTLTFETNNVSYKIIRGRKPSIFKFIKDGVEKDTNEDESQGEGRHTQEEIEKLIGISHAMFGHLVALNTYTEPFLSLKSNDQRIIIEQLLGITKLSEKADKLKEESRLVKDSIKEEEFRIAAVNETNKRIQQNIQSLKLKSASWDKDRNTKISELQSSIESLLNVNIDDEISLHNHKKEVEDLTAEYRSLSRELSNLESEVSNSNKVITKLNKILNNSVDKICPTCNQEMDKATHEAVHKEYTTQFTDISAKLHEKVAKRDEVRTLTASVSSLIPKMPVTFYDTLSEAYNHKTTLTTLGNSLAAELDIINPYTDQIESLTNNGLQPVDFTKINGFVKLRDHQDLLLKLLTHKDSVIRKKIIDQNLAYLNIRLTHYLTEIGLPHTVKFKSDLEVEINMYGKEFDFDNLSRGERTRLILALSWTFRDVYESMNGKLNLLFLDEILDNGVDSAGIESAVTILKTMARHSDRNIFLISHRDECISRISETIKVVKENGFTTIETV
jgi:DNA repair exonuclease SbcCD ATPase subunit